MSFTGNNPSFKTTTLRPMSAQPANPVEGMIYYDDGTTNTEGVYKYQNSNWEFISSLVDFLRLIPQSADPVSPTAGDIQYSDGTVRTVGLWQFNGTTWERVGNNVEDFNYIPQNADPTSPVEGQTFFSDGTSRTEGLWTFVNADWSPLGQAAQAQVQIISENLPIGTSGGTFTSGAWQTRQLNTTSGDSFATVSSNQFTLPAGKYVIEASAIARGVRLNRVRLQNITDSTTDILGTSLDFENEGSFFDQGEAELVGCITLTSPKTFELQHRCSLTQNTFGFGLATNFGGDEIYSVVSITKLN